MKVAVIGGGIIGSTCAYQALKTNIPIKELHIYADKTTNDTTSNGAAGLWNVANVGKTPREKIDRWAQGSLRYAIDVLSYDPDAAAKGFAPNHGFYFSQEPIPDDASHRISFVKLSEADIRERFPHFTKDIKYGVSYSSYTLQSDRYLPYLKKEIEKLGGLFINRKIKSLNEISQRYDIIFNCSGLGARDLVNDTEVYPIRGQIMYVKAPWVKEVVHSLDLIDGNILYVIPNIDRVVIGGTYQENVSRLTPTKEDREWILENAKKLIPGIEKAEIIGEWVGIRPGRSEIRLEMEKIAAPVPEQPERSIPVIHNYGHGAYGITLSWGCAENAIEILVDCYKNILMEITIKSKL